MAKRTYTRWTVETLTAIAQKHKTTGEFFEKDPAAYMAAKRKKVFDDITKHMTKRKEWTLKSVKEAASKFKSRGAFAEGNRAAYSAAIRKGWLDEACENMPRYAGKGKTRGKNKRTKPADLSSIMGL